MPLSISILYVVASGITFVAFFLLTPVIYQVLEGTCLADANQDDQQICNNLFNTWQIMGFVIPGVLMFWGLANAHRTTSRDFVR